MTRRGLRRGSAASIEEQVNTVIGVTFDVDEDDLPEAPSVETMSQWTCRTQTTLVLNLEERFGVSFSLEQMVSMTSARRIAELLAQILGQPPGT